MRELLQFEFVGNPVLKWGLAVITFLVTLTVRGVIALKRYSLWSLRNRLLLTYGLFGVLPILLLFTLAGLGAWALMNELAIYLASSALDRRLERAGRRSASSWWTSGTGSSCARCPTTRWTT